MRSKNNKIAKFTVTMLKELENNRIMTNKKIIIVRHLVSRV